MDSISKYREIYHNLLPEDKVDFIKSLSPEAFNEFRYFTDFTLRPKQIVPEDWSGRYFIALAGRGWGKSKMGAYWIKTKVYLKHKGLAIVAPTYKDLEEIMVPAIQDEFPPEHKPKYLSGNKAKIICHNGIEILCFTSDQEIRGGNFSYVWCDELAKWCESIPEKIQNRFDILNFACRKGQAQFLITTTGKDFPIFHNWMKRFKEKDPNVMIISGTMEENYALSPEAKQALYDEFAGTRLGRQELMGELLTTVEGALWTQDTIDKSRISKQEFERRLKHQELYLNRTIVAIDPAVTSKPNSDETAIYVGALGHDNHIYVFANHSCKLPPAQWAQKAITAFDTYQANLIVAEINNGGEMVAATLRSIDPKVPIKVIHTTRGKVVRAEPVASLHERGEIHLVGEFPELEYQLTHFTGCNSVKHDDQLDSFVYLCNELRLSKVYVPYDINALPHF